MVVGSFSGISAASTVSVRIQIAIGPEYKRSVSYLEYKSQEVWTAAKGALQWRMPIEMRPKNASEIKRRMSSAVQSTPALQFQLIPALPPPTFQQVDTGSFFIMIPVFKYHLLSLSLFFSPFLNHHIENNIQPLLSTAGSGCRP